MSKIKENVSKIASLEEYLQLDPSCLGKAKLSSTYVLHQKFFPNFLNICQHFKSNYCKKIISYSFLAFLKQPPMQISHEVETHSFLIHAIECVA
jgi:hypothetical protein